MAEETETTQAKPEETIEQLYAAVKPSFVAPETQTKPAAAPTGVPEDASLEDRVSHMGKQLGSLIEQISQDRESAKARYQAEEKAQAERDLSSAVSRLTEKAGLTPDKADLVKGYLMVQAEKSEALQGLWDQRASAPKAFEAAIDSLATGLMDALAIKTDATAADSQRAIDDAMKHQASRPPAEESQSDKYVKMNDSEFAVAWARLVGHA